MYEWLLSENSPWNIGSCQRNQRMLTRQCLHRLHISLRNEMNYNAYRTGEIGLTTCDVGVAVLSVCSSRCGALHRCCGVLHRCSWDGRGGHGCGYGREGRKSTRIASTHRNRLIRCRFGSANAICTLNDLSGSAEV
jgi:hypothetical protein